MSFLVHLGLEGIGNDSMFSVKLIIVTVLMGYGRVFLL